MNLFKRNPDNPECPYTVRFAAKGKVYNWSTKTTDKRLAETRAKDYRNKIVAGAYGLADAMKQRNGAPTFKQVFDIYLKLAVPAEHTRKRNVAYMKAVLAASGLDETARLDKLGSALAMTARDKAVNDRPGCNSAMVSANSAMRHSRSIWAKHAMLAYRETLTIPMENVAAFFEVPFLDAMKSTKELPTDEAVAAATLRLKDNHPDEYRAFLLALVAGCRADEIRHARRSWINGTTLTIGAFPDQFRPKSGKARSIALPEAVVPILLAGDDPVFLVGPRRNPIVDRELNAILKDCGFPAHPLHSLRRRFGSIVFSTQSAEVAQMLLGHASIVTTQDHYAHCLTKPAPIAWAG